MVPSVQVSFYDADELKVSWRNIQMSWKHAMRPKLIRCSTLCLAFPCCFHLLINRLQNKSTWRHFHTCCLALKHVVIVRNNVIHCRSAIVWWTVLNVSTTIHTSTDIWIQLWSLRMHSGAFNSLTPCIRAVHIRSDHSEYKHKVSNRSYCVLFILECWSSPDLRQKCSSVHAF